MTIDRLVLLPLLVGHLALFILLLNITHALGHRDQIMSRVKLALLVGCVVGMSILAWEAWQAPVSGWSWPSLVYGSVCLVTGLLLLPGATAYLHHRPRPTNAAEESVEIDLAAEEGAQELIGAGKHAWILRLPRNESLRLRTIESRLTHPWLPHDLDGLTVLHFSDLHLAPCYRRRFFDRVFELAAAMPVDLALFTGDLVDHDDVVAWIEPLFSRVRGRLGSYAILGNHDIEHDTGELKRRLHDAGYTDLEGRWTTVTNDAGLKVAIGGTSYPWGPQLPLDVVPSADFRIVMSHAPDQFYRLAGGGVELMLSGHNHGGQIRLPLIGPVFMPSRYSRRFDRGYFARERLLLHVSQGVSGQHPYRLGCAPEITRITLRASCDRREHARAESPRTRMTASGRS